ncbi:MAG: cytochrome P450 [Candidatus Omnitrophica bacterium]|nr:cytochrome P450 [Candidatus Omnitrophota bacterium]
MKPDFYPPGPSSISSIGAYLKLFQDPLSFLMQASRKYGDICCMRLGARQDYLINHPELIKQVILSPEIYERSTSRALRKIMGKGLLTADLESHSQQKRCLQPAFQKQGMLEYASTICTMVEQFNHTLEEQETIDVAKAMNHLALEIVVRTLLGVEMSRQEEQIIEAIETIKCLTDQKKSAFIDPLLSKLPLPQSIAYQKACQCLDQKVYEIIQKKREQPLQGCDLVTTLLKAMDIQDCPFLSDQLVRDEVMTMFMAGHETVASAMTWTWYLLSQNHEVEKHFHAELDEILGEGPIQAEHVAKLPYTRKILLESMRIYPPVWLIVRHPLVDTQLGGYTIPAGSYVHLCQYTMHRDPRYFPDPEKFDPERWTPEAVAKRPKFSYFPFGGGKRQCIGEAFAMTEGIIVLASLGRKWVLRQVSKDPIRLDPLITLRPRNGLRMGLKKRSGKVTDEFLPRV